MHALTQTRDLLCRSQTLCHHAMLLEDKVHLVHTLILYSFLFFFFYLLFFKFVDAKTIGKKVEKYEMVVHWSNRVENMCFFFVSFVFFFFFF
jgi:hypothetical protein